MEESKVVSLVGILLTGASLRITSPEGREANYG